MKATELARMPPKPPLITDKLKVGMTRELRLSVERCARLSGKTSSVLAREILEIQVSRRLARLEARNGKAAAAA